MFRAISAESLRPLLTLRDLSLPNVQDTNLKLTGALKARDGHLQPGLLMGY